MSCPCLNAASGYGYEFTHSAVYHSVNAFTEWYTALCVNALVLCKTPSMSFFPRWAYFYSTICSYITTLCAGPFSCSCHGVLP